MPDTPTAPPIRWKFPTAGGADKPLSVERIAEIVNEQGQYSPGSSRNRFLYEVSKFARKKGHSAEEVTAWARATLEAEDFTAREIATTVRSAVERRHR